MTNVRNLAAWFMLTAALGACGADPGESDVGAIEVTVKTTGSSLDADGYTIAVGDLPAEPIASNGEKRITELLPGEYPARLGGLAANCYMEERNPLPVLVTPGKMTTVEFHVVCTVPGAGVLATIQSTGHDLDPNGYLLQIGSARAQRVPINGVANLTVLEEGTLSLALSDLAPNCTADPTNPTTVRVVEGERTPITLKLNCAVSTGAIRFTPVLSGEDLQAGEFVVLLNNTAITVVPGRSVVTAGLKPGEQSVYVLEYGLQSNCVPSGSNPLTVTVGAGDTVDVELDVACTRLARLTITVTTTGESIDPNGYTLQLSSSDYYRGLNQYDVLLPSNGSVVSPPMQQGEYTTLLSGLAPNCRLAASTPNPIIVSTVDVSILYVIECRRET